MGGCTGLRDADSGCRMMTCLHCMVQIRSELAVGNQKFVEATFLTRLRRRLGDEW